MSKTTAVASRPSGKTISIGWMGCPRSFTRLSTALLSAPRARVGRHVTVRVLTFASQPPVHARTCSRWAPESLAHASDHRGHVVAHHAIRASVEASDDPLLFGRRPRPERD